MTKSYVFRLPKKRLILILAILVSVTLIVLSIKPIQRLIYPIRYEKIVTEMAETYTVPPSLIYAVIHTESKFDRFALSSANARGLMQITEDTYRWVCQRTGQEFLEADSLYDPYVNTQCGVALIHLLQGKFENTKTVLAAYNAGQGRTSEWLKIPAYSQDGKTLTHIPYEETENYVRRVINTQKKYQKLYNIQ